MKITLGIESLAKGLATMQGVLTDKMSADELRNVIFRVKDGKLSLVAYSPYITTYTDIEDAEVDWEGAEAVDVFYFQTKAELNSIVGTFTSLKRTVVESIEFKVEDTLVLMTVQEVPVDTMDEMADKLYQKSVFKLERPKFKEGIRKALIANDYDVTGDIIACVDILSYLDILLPTIPADVRVSSGTQVYFGEEYVYTMPQIYVAMLKNTLPAVLHNFVLTQSMASFLKAFLALSESVQIQRTDTDTLTTLCLYNGTSKAIIIATGTKTLFKLDAWLGHSSTGVVLDKLYFSDTLKRMAISTDGCNITLHIEEDGTATGEIISKKLKLPLSIILGRLNCEEFEEKNLVRVGENGKRYVDIAFNLKAEQMSRLILAHSDFTSDVYLYFEPDKNIAGAVTLTVADTTGVWLTKIKSLVAKRGDFAWN